MQIDAPPRYRARRGVEPKVGHVYATRQGLNGYFIIVGISHPGKHERPFNNVHMIRFNMAHEVVGTCNEPEDYVRHHKDLVGELEALPLLKVKWYD